MRVLASTGELCACAGAITPRGAWRAASLAVMFAAFALALPGQALAEDPPSRANHGIALSMSCESPKCVGEWLECFVDIDYNDECQDAITIHEAYAVVDPDGHDTRVPATGNLWITGAWGNTTISTDPGDWPMPFTPFLIGSPFDTYGGLPGADATGRVRVALLPDDPTFGYQIQDTDPDPLRTFAWITWEDMCNHYEHEECPDCPAGALLPAATASDTLVNQNPTCDPIDDGPKCEGEIIQICANASGGTPPYTYLWDSGETTECIDVTAAGEYCVTVTDANGCEGYCCKTASFYPNPTCDPTNDGPKCEGESIQLCANASGGTPPYTYLWDSGQTVDCINVTTGGEYCVTVTDANGCQAYCCTTAVFVPNPTCDPTDDGPKCEGDTIQICANASGGTPPYTYLWDSGETTECIDVTTGGDYCVTVTDANGCQGYCCTTVEFVPNPTCDPTDDGPKCEGETIQICANASDGTPPYTYLWDGGETTECIDVTTAGEYCVTVTDANGCEAYCCKTANFYPNPTCDATNDGPGCEGETVQVCANPSGGTPPYTYLWNTGETTECIDVTTAGEYCVTVTDANGCEAYCCSEVVIESGAIGDFVWYDDNQDGCQDPGEMGVAGVTVTLIAGCDGTEIIATTTTDADGFYLFEGVCAGDYLVVFDIPDGYVETVPNNAACDGGDEADSDTVDGMVCVNVPTNSTIDLSIDCGIYQPEGGGEGCTPGYWKQEQHFGNWTAPYTPDTLFSDVFEDAFPGMTLLDVLWQGGGGLKALGRHTVAALLNAASADVDYDLSVSDVIDMFNDVFPGSKDDYNGLKDDWFAPFNESGCPLGRADEGDDGLLSTVADDGGGNVMPDGPASCGAVSGAVPLLTLVGLVGLRIKRSAR